MKSVIKFKMEENFGFPLSIVLTVIPNEQRLLIFGIVFEILKTKICLMSIQDENNRCTSNFSIVPSTRKKMEPFFFFFKESWWEGKEAQEFATQPICFSLRGQHKDSFRYAGLRKYITHMFLLEKKDISRHVLVIWEMNQNGEFKKGDEIVQKD